MLYIAEYDPIDPRNLSGTLFVCGNCCTFICIWKCCKRYTNTPHRFEDNIVVQNITKFCRFNRSIIGIIWANNIKLFACNDGIGDVFLKCFYIFYYLLDSFLLQVILINLIRSIIYLNWLSMYSFLFENFLLLLSFSHVRSLKYNPVSTSTTISEWMITITTYNSLREQ